MAVPRLVAMVVLLVPGVLAGCGGSPNPTSTLPPATTSPAAGPTAAGSATSPGASVDPKSFDPTASGLMAACGGAFALATAHQAPDLEELLPDRLGGRMLSRWSVRGECALELLFGGTPVNVDDLLEEVNTPGTRPVDVDALRYAIAGRSDVARDPPYFVYGAARPDDEDEIQMNLLLLLGGGSFEDVVGAAQLTGFDDRTIAGKDVFVGNPSMLRQSEHQRGTPYLYQTDDAMFLVITDDEAWAEEAFSTLP